LVGFNTSGDTGDTGGNINTGNNGNTEKPTHSFWDWIMYIFLFGWIWM